jgi:phenylacetate-coenzyme A ligase PaaK-like adenylate-forming protein
LPGFEKRAAAFGHGAPESLERFNVLLARARSLRPAYDAACAAALGEEAGLRHPGEISRLPIMTRADLASYGPGGALASLESGGTGSAGRVETRLDLRAVAARYAALLSVLKDTGWRMGDRTAALHPVEYSYFGNLPGMLSGGRLGRVFFEFFQQYVLYRLVHNRVNVYYSGDIFPEPGAALALAEKAAAENPVLLISRPDALMAVLKVLRVRSLPGFNKLKAVLTVGTALGESVRAEAKARLGCEVFNMYASTELGYAALSCRDSGGWLHADGTGHILERSADGGIICTDLDNALTPLLRYDTGDIGELAERGCLCGRSGIMLKVKGRKDKFALAAEGHVYEAELIDRVFPTDLPFFQLDRSERAVLLPPGSGEREAGAVRELLALAPGDFGGVSAGGFKISSSGKFSYLP